MKRNTTTILHPTLLDGNSWKKTKEVLHFLILQYVFLFNQGPIIGDSSDSAATEVGVGRSRTVVPGALQLPGPNDWRLGCCQWVNFLLFDHLDAQIPTLFSRLQIQICILIYAHLFLCVFTANHDYNYCNDIYSNYFLYLMQNCIPLVCNYVSLYFLKFVWIARFGICTSTRLSDSQQINFGNSGLPRRLVVVSTMFVFSGLGNKPNNNVPTCFHINWWSTSVFLQLVFEWKFRRLVGWSGFMTKHRQMEGWTIPLGLMKICPVQKVWLYFCSKWRGGCSCF